MSDKGLKKILVTGASGFVGDRFLKGKGNEYTLVPVSLREKQIHDINWRDISAVLHLAGIAHRMQKTEDELYYDVNYELTKKLADAAKKAGVKQFIFMSTIKVYGEGYQKISLDTPCKPNDAYGKSKLLAEHYLQELSSPSFKVAIIRPPLIYGPGVKGNMARLINLVEQKKYLPLGEINNKRSIVSIDNLIHLMDIIIEREAEGIFLVQDNKPISTSDLLIEIINAQNSRTKLFEIPGIVKWAIARLTPAIYMRVFGSLEVDDSTTRALLNYMPLEDTSEGILKMIKSYNNE